MQLVNCVLTNNSAGNTGGAVYNTSLAEIVNCTVAANSAVNYAGGILNAASCLPMFLNNSIVYFNSAGSAANLYYPVSYMPPLVSHSDIQGCGGSGNHLGSSPWVSSFGIDCGGNIDANPHFVSSTDLRLQQTTNPANQCINGGDNSFVHEPLDIAGNRRICTGIIDMGAYESPVAQCGGVSILDVEYDQTNITDEVGHGWQDKTLTLNCGSSYVISDTFWVEDSSSCPPYKGNSNIQSGSCHITINIPQGGKSVTFSVEGKVEKRDTDYDYGRIYCVTGTEECPYNFDDHYDAGANTPKVSICSGTSGDG